MVKVDNNLRKLPALLAPIRAPNGDIEAVHRIFLTRDGQIAPLDQPKLFTSSPGIGAIWFGNKKPITSLSAKALKTHSPS